MAEWIKKIRPIHMRLQETHFRSKTHTNSVGMEKDIPCKWK